MNNTYVLEHPGEAARLEYQAQSPNYRLETELRDFYAVAGHEILDAGCGSGLLSRFLVKRFDGVAITACDGSSTRLDQARQLASEAPYNTIRFIQSYLEEIDSPDARFDSVICRFVLEHVDDPFRVAKEFYRVTKAGGQVCVIDVDGILFNLHSPSRELSGLLAELKSGWKTDLYVGRKLPHILAAAGFHHVNWRIETMQFRDESLAHELELTKHRFDFIRPTLKEILGTEERVGRFCDLYCSEMMREESTLFYNKFIVFARR